MLTAHENVSLIYVNACLECSIGRNVPKRSRLDRQKSEGKKQPMRENSKGRISMRYLPQLWGALGKARLRRSRVCSYLSPYTVGLIVDPSLIANKKIT